jgi:lipopolysaccharide transport system permease protein
VVSKALAFNPASHLVWMYQDALFYGRITRPWSWGITLVGAFGLFFLGFGVFRRLKTYFGNAL